jgi:hypothetical protein
LLWRRTVDPIGCKLMQSAVNSHQSRRKTEAGGGGASWLQRPMPRGHTKGIGHQVVISFFLPTRSTKWFPVVWHNW